LPDGISGLRLARRSVFMWYNWIVMANFSGLLHRLSSAFNDKGVRYALIGGFALHAAGYSRATGDVDLLVHREDIGAVKETLSGLGYKVIYEDANVVNLASPWQLVRRGSLALRFRLLLMTLNAGRGIWQI
jgi:hypothetical protein